MRASKLAVAVTFTCVALRAGSAWASSDKPRVAVCGEGSGVEGLREEAEQALGDSAEIEACVDLERAWASLGLGGKPRVDMGSSIHHEAALTNLRDAARLARLDAVVIVAAGRGKGATHVVMVTPSVETPIVDARVDRKKGKPRIRVLVNAGMQYATALKPAAPSAEPSAPPPMTAPVASTAPPASAPSEAQDSVPTLTSALTSAGAGGDPDHVAREVSRDDRKWIDVAAGLELGGRDFRYNDRISPSLRSYSVVGAPMAAASIDLAPFAGGPLQRGGALTGLGVMASAATSFALSSRADAGGMDTSWVRFGVGMRYRARVAGGVDLGASLSYVGESFELTGGAPGMALPSVAYRDIRPGLEFQLPLGRVRVLAKVGYHDVLSAGAVADRMQGAKVGGIDGELGADIALGGGFAARLEASYRRYFYSFEPQPGASYVAGGALDQLASVGTSLVWTH